MKRTKFCLTLSAAPSMTNWVMPPLKAVALREQAALAALVIFLICFLAVPVLEEDVRQDPNGAPICATIWKLPLRKLHLGWKQRFRCREQKNATHVMVQALRPAHIRRPAVSAVVQDKSKSFKIHLLAEWSMSAAVLAAAAKARLSKHLAKSVTAKERSEPNGKLKLKSPQVLITVHAFA